jgi:hypothetical protein
MTKRIFTVLIALTLIAADVYQSRLAAQFVGNLDWTEFPQDSPSPFANVPSCYAGRNSIVLMSRDGRIMPVANSSLTPFSPFGQDIVPLPLNFSYGGFLNPTTPDLLFVAPGGAAVDPLRAYTLTSNPPSSLGDLPIEGIRSGGLNIHLANYFGDPTPEMGLSFGVGGPGTISIFGVSDDEMIELEPWPGYRGGVRTAGADFDGDGFADLLAAQMSGGEAKAYRYVNGVLVEYGHGRPLGHGYNGGLDVDVFDFNCDNRPEAIFSSLSQRSQGRIYDFNDRIPQPVYDFDAFENMNRPRIEGVQIEPGVANGRDALWIWGVEDTLQLQLERNGTTTVLRRNALFDPSPFLHDQRNPIVIETFTPPAVNRQERRR